MRAIPFALVVTALALAAGCTRPNARPSGPDADVPVRSAEELSGMLDEARAALEAEEHKRVVEILDEFALYSPEDPDMLRMRGAALFELGRLEDAIKDLDAALKADPDHADAELRLAEAYDLRNDPASAEPHAARAAELLADDYSAYYLHGLLLMEVGRPADAAKAFKAADELNLNQPDILLSLAEAYLESGQWELARDQANMAADIAAGNAGGAEWSDLYARAYAAMARSELGEGAESGDEATREAKKEIAKAYLAQIEPAVGDPDLARYYVARAWREAGHPESARFTLGDVKPPPDLAWAQAEYARVCLAVGEDYPGAAAAAARAAELSEPDAELLSLKGWAAFKNKDYQVARESLEAALESARTDAMRGEICYRLFRACEALNDPEEAARHRSLAKEYGYVEP